jgi:aryl-alcohol dehydrogenase-like predicted oxidoreductase
MKYRDFGNTGIKVSEVGFGGWGIGGNEHGHSYGSTDDKVSLDAINKAFDLGCNFFDTADVYGFGHSETLLGKALKSKRDRVIIATKVGSDFYQGGGFQTFTDEYIRFALEKSLDRLRTDYVDVYQLHNPPIRLLKKDNTYNTLQDLKREGKIRAWGISIRDPIEGMTALAVSQPDCIQIPVNIFNSRPVETLLPAAFAVGCAVIAREPLANGFLTGKFGQTKEVSFEEGDVRQTWPPDYILARIEAARRLEFLQKENRTLTQAAIKFVLSLKEVSVTIPGTKTPEQAEENLGASDLKSLTDTEMKEIDALAKRNFDLPEH